jgi:hypothetical protein
MPIVWKIGYLPQDLEAGNQFGEGVSSGESSATNGVRKAEAYAVVSQTTR